jgi:hypothetical protein
MDHVLPWAEGGTTTAANGAGLCEACNHTKELPGWTSRPRPGPADANGPGHRHTLGVTTPTGHRYHSTAPPLPGTILAGTALSVTSLPGTALSGTAQPYTLRAAEDGHPFSGPAAPTARTLGHELRRKLRHHAKAARYAQAHHIKVA